MQYLHDLWLVLALWIAGAVAGVINGRRGLLIRLRVTVMAVCVAAALT